jgi:hypothetical protein
MWLIYIEIILFAGLAIPAFAIKAYLYYNNHKHRAA